MAGDYFLRPREKPFKAETLRRAREYWESKPHYIRSDGALMNVETQEEAERVVQNKTTDVPWWTALLIEITEREIVLATMGCPRDMELYRFAEWLHEIQPFIVFDESGVDRSLEWFRKDLGG